MHNAHKAIPRFLCFLLSQISAEKIRSYLNRMARILKKDIPIIEHGAAKTQYRKFETNIPRKGTARLQSQFLQSCFCERFLYSSDRSAYSAVGKQEGRSGNI